MLFLSPLFFQLLQYGWILSILPLYFGISEEDGLRLGLTFSVFYFVKELIAASTSRGGLKLISISVHLFTIPILLLPIVIPLSAQRSIPSIALLCYIYKSFLRLTAPLLTVLEGFATIVVVRFVGKYITEKLDEEETNDGGRAFKILFLLFSIILYCVDVYILYNIYSSSNLSTITASLLSCVITTIHFSAILIRLRSNLDSTVPPITDDIILFAYLVMNVFLMSYSWQAQPKVGSFSAMEGIAGTLKKMSTPSLNDLFDLSQLAATLYRLLAYCIQSRLLFDVSMIILLLYRTVIFSLALLVIKRLNESDDVYYEQSDQTPFSLSLLQIFVKPAVIAFYTHFLLIHFNYMDDYSVAWKWINMFSVLAMNIIYGFVSLEE